MSDLLIEKYLGESVIVEASGKEIAAKMKLNKTLKSFADKVAKKKKITSKELDEMLPDYISGVDIAALFK